MWASAHRPCGPAQIPLWRGVAGLQPDRTLGQHAAARRVPIHGTLRPMLMAGGSAKPNAGIRRPGFAPFALALLGAPLRLFSSRFFRRETSHALDQLHGDGLGEGESDGALLLNSYGASSSIERRDEAGVWRVERVVLLPTPKKITGPPGIYVQGSLGDHSSAVGTALRMRARTRSSVSATPLLV